MRAVIQRVKEAQVTCGESLSGRIDRGLMVLLGIKKGDTRHDMEYLVNKIVNLRIFEDKNGKMNLSALEMKFDILVVSEFTLYGDCRKGFRPNFQDSAPAEEAQRLYDQFIEKIKESGLKIASGVFKAMMDVALVNDGPVTIIIDS
ncbi:MAG: D-tyrosyl-tRNA(Tyr) deacylase [Spirochaetes bacterium]|nr:D-tyrosyl-tRNA(Tyr) deacylase [Spirochaetota bacterium]